ncbi:MAG: hypothetical protein V4492_02655, partial [Chlamydiota bacterium]
MIRDEYNRLIKAFEEGAAGKTIDLQEVFAQTLEFFEHLKDLLKTGTTDEKRDALKMMAELYQKMMEETKKICERSGMTEEQLLAVAENPKNFTPDQWNLIAECKKKIAQAGENISKTVQPIVEQGEGKGAGAPPQGEKKTSDSLKRARKS